MTRLPRLALPLALLACATSLAAQEQGAGDKPDETWGGTEIVVTGRNPNEIDQREVTRQARAISRETNLRHQPVARFADPACPGVAGLQVNYAETVVARFRLVAEELKIPLAPEGKCRPNIIIAFSKDPRAGLKALNDRTGVLSYNLPASERRELLDSRRRLSAARREGAAPWTRLTALLLLRIISEWLTDFDSPHQRDDQ